MSKRDRERFDLAGELGAARPRAPRRFIDTLAARAGASRSGVRGARPAVVALVGIGSLAVMGGIGFAASTAIESSNVAVKRVTADSARTIAVRAAAADQYSIRDRVLLNDNKPPELKVTPPAGGTLKAVQPSNRADVVLRTTIEVKESGTLYIAVNSASRKTKKKKPLEFKINGAASYVDGDVVSTKVRPVQLYVIEKPRLLTIEVSVPGSQLNAGEKLTLLLSYRQTDPAGTTKDRTTTIAVPARAPATIAASKSTRRTVTVTLTTAQIKRIRALLAEKGRKNVTVNLIVQGTKAAVAWQWGGKATKVNVYPDNPKKLNGRVTLDTLYRTAEVTASGTNVSAGFQIKG